VNTQDKKNESLFSVLLLHSVSAALRAEKLLKKENLAIQVIPVPRHLSSDCGVCVRFERKDLRKVEEILTKSQLEMQGIYPI
jgi:hypothetical protein